MPKLIIDFDKISVLLENKDRFYEYIKPYTENIPKAKIEKEIDDFAQRFNSDDLFQEAIWERSDEIIFNYPLIPKAVYAWKMFKCVHCKEDSNKIIELMREIENEQWGEIEEEYDKEEDDDNDEEEEEEEEEDADEEDDEELRTEKLEQEVNLQNYTSEEIENINFIENIFKMIKINEEKHGSEKKGDDKEHNSKERKKINFIQNALKIMIIKFNNKLKLITNGLAERKKIFKEEMAIFKILKERCDLINQESISFYKMMDDAKIEFTKKAEEQWLNLSDDERIKKWYNDYNDYKKVIVKKEMDNWLLEHENDRYVQYCLKVHLSGVNKKKHTKELVEEIKKMVEDKSIDSSIRKALKAFIKECENNDYDIRSIIINHRCGKQNKKQINIALNYLSRNSKIIGHDCFKFILNKEKELDYLLNKTNIDFNKYITNDNRSFQSVFLVSETNCPINEVQPHEARNNKINNVPMRYERNKFYIENCLAIGGGNVNKLNTASDYVRIGGSKLDKIRYLTNYDSAKNTSEDYAQMGAFSLSPKELARKIFPVKDIIGKLKILSKDKITSTLKINLDANPGYILHHLGYKDKRTSLSVTQGAYDIIYDSWTTSKDGAGVQIYWTMASRPKLMTREKALSKVRHEEAVGRVISLPDSIEQWIHHPIWYPIMERIKEYNKQCLFGYTPIMLGVHRTGISWSYLSEHMKKWKYIYTGDWSQYDQRINKYLWENAINAIQYLFDRSDPHTNNYINNWIKFTRDQVMNGTYIIDSKIMLERIGGVPSGSLLTSLIDSITNYNAIYEVMIAMGYKDDEFEVGTYGDDHYVLFNELKCKSIDEFKTKFSDISMLLFNFKCSTNDTNVCKTEFMYVGYKRPIYKEDPLTLSKGTSHLKPIKFEYSDHIFKDYDLTKGQTHRQMYDFKNRPSFLSYYWRDDGMPIRPLIECQARILNPENKVKNIFDHVALLWSWIFENLFNSHSVNDGFFMILDSEWMKAEAELWNGIENVVLREDSEYKTVWNSTPDKLLTEGTRMWFRRRSDINGRIPIEKEDKFIDEFSKRFTETFVEYNKIYMKSVYENETYDTRNQLYNHICRHANLGKFKLVGSTETRYDPIGMLMKDEEEIELNENAIPDQILQAHLPDNFANYENIKRREYGLIYFKILQFGSKNIDIEEINKYLQEQKVEIDKMEDNLKKSNNEENESDIRYNVISNKIVKIIRCIEKIGKKLYKMKKLTKTIDYDIEKYTSKKVRYKRFEGKTELYNALLTSDTSEIPNFTYGKSSFIHSTYDIKTDIPNIQELQK